MPILKGINPAMPTPFSADGMALNLDMVKPLCDFLIDRGVDGVFICGTTGEGPLLTAEEKLSLIERTLKAVEGRINVFAQVASSNFSGTLKTARLAPRMGVTAVSLLQPWFYDCDDEAQYTYAARIADAIGDFPLFLYNIPGNSGNNLQPSTLQRLLENCSNIRGIKESGSVENIDRWMQFRSEQFEVVCGIDTENATTFQKGGVGLVSSTANVQAQVFRAMCDHAQRGEWDQAHERQLQIGRILDVLDPRNLIAGVKAFFRFQGIDLGGVRPPLRNLYPEERDRLQQGFRDLGLL